MTYYRGDLRDGLTSVQGQGVYADSGGRPKDCKKETAFADSIGGAAYGAAQFLTSDQDEEVKPQDFLDQTTKFTVHIYETDEEPDYYPAPTATHDMLGVSTDFDITGEGRFCDRKVPVKKICSIPITGHDVAVLQSLLYRGCDKQFFDYDAVMSPECRQEEEQYGGCVSMECCQQYYDFIDRIIKNDIPLMEQTVLPKVRDPDFECEMLEGIDDGVAITLLDVFASRCQS